MLASFRLHRWLRLLDYSKRLNEDAPQRFVSLTEKRSIQIFHQIVGVF